MFVALMELALRQTGADGLTHFLVRRSCGVRKRFLSRLRTGRPDSAVVSPAGADHHAVFKLYVCT